MSENTNTKKTFAERAAAEPTDLHKRFADWLKEQTGVDVDLKTVQLVITLRMDFQKSDDNQTALAERKAKAAEEAAKKAAARKAKLLAELAKLEGETVVAESVKVAIDPASDAGIVVVADTETPAGPAPDGLGDKQDAPAEPKAPARRAPRKRTTAAKK